MRPLTRFYDDQIHTFNITLLAGLDTIYYPNIWFETVAGLPDEDVGMMKLMTASPNIGLGVGIGALVLGAILCVLSTIACYKSKKVYV